MKGQGQVKGQGQGSRSNLKIREGGGGGGFKELIPHINESEMYMLNKLVTHQVLKGQGQRSRVKVKVKPKNKGGGVFISYVFVKSMKLKGELLPERDVGPFWDQ